MGRKIAFIILLILIIVIIIIAARIQYRSIINTKRIKRIRAISQNDILYNYIIGDTNNDLVKRLTHKLTEKQRTVHEDVMLGNIWKLVMNDNDIAQAYYNTAIDRITQRQIDEIDLNDYYQLLNHTNETNDIDALQATLLLTSTEAPRIDQLNIRKEVTSDPQNVHDSHVNSQMKKDYEFIQAYIGTPATYDEYVSVAKHVRSQLSKYQQREYFGIQNYYSKFLLFDEPEWQIFANIWKYITHPTQTQTGLLQEGFIDAVRDSFEDNGFGEGLVCAHGRISKLLGSLATSDINDKGIFQTDQIVRNDCFNIAAKARNKALETATQQQRDDYNNNTVNDSSTAFTNNILDSVHKEIKQQYPDFDNKKMSAILAEINTFI